MLLSASAAIIFLIILVTLWDPHGLTSAVITVLGGGLITLFATLSHQPWAVPLADLGKLIILGIAVWGLFTLFLIIGTPAVLFSTFSHHLQRDRDNCHGPFVFTQFLV